MRIILFGPRPGPLALDHHDHDHDHDDDDHDQADDDITNKDTHKTPGASPVGNFVFVFGILGVPKIKNVCIPENRRIFGDFCYLGKC